mmetsp:Transcript_23993/g.38585  ORF Transcript_23993/g.38585 Transcript_23993/m.38585 type:complete len:220 (+) Transcript_23993:614-1273(+)
MRPASSSSSLLSFMHSSPSSPSASPYFSSCTNRRSAFWLVIASSCSRRSTRSFSVINAVSSSATRGLGVSIPSAPPTDATAVEVTTVWRSSLKKRPRLRPPPLAPLPLDAVSPPPPPLPLPRWNDPPGNDPPTCSLPPATDADIAATPPEATRLVLNPAHSALASRSGAVRKTQSSAECRSTGCAARRARYDSSCVARCCTKSSSDVLTRVFSGRGGTK